MPVGSPRWRKGSRPSAWAVGPVLLWGPRRSPAGPRPSAAGLLPAPPEASLAQAPQRGPETPVSSGRGAGAGEAGPWGAPLALVFAGLGLWPELKGTEQRDPVARPGCAEFRALGGASAVAGKGPGTETGGVSSALPLGKRETEPQRSARLTRQEGLGDRAQGGTLPPGTTKACLPGPAAASPAAVAGPESRLPARPLGVSSGPRAWSVLDSG